MQIKKVCTTAISKARNNLKLQRSNRKELACDAFNLSTDNGISEITGFYCGIFGTQCKGSKPLKDFLKAFQATNLEKLISKGQSTNIKGQAYSLLKTKADRPISTSEVRDCSVMYLHNKNTNTHFLYHMYRDNSLKDIDYLIKTCMPEGYSDAIIVPGAKYFESTHKRYLPDAFEAIKQNSPQARINVYHYSSNMPEVVFLNGKAYEIPNPQGGDIGQATFKIKDYRTYETFNEVGRCKTLEELDKLNTEIKRRKIDKEIRKILQNLIKERRAVISEILSCKTEEELDIIAEKYDGGRKKFWSPDTLGCRGYFDVIKKQSFMIAEGKV